MISFEYNEKPLENIDSPFVYEFVIPQDENTQISITQEKVTLPEIDPETGLNKTQNTALRVRIFMKENNALAIKQDIQSQVQAKAK